MRTRAYRTTRMGVLAFVVLAISLAGHAAGSSALPTSFGLLLALALTMTLSSIAVLRARSVTWLLGFVIALQLLLHFVLVIVGGGAHEGAGHGSLIPSLAGVLGHLGAALIAALVLKFGDDLLDRWAYLLSRVFGEIELPRVSIACITRVVATRGVAEFSSVTLGSAPGRGPPVFSS